MTLHNYNPTNISEALLIFILGAVQFVNIVDFMMVIPMGPDFAEALTFKSNDIALIGAIYTFAAFLSGFICSLFIDNYDRKKLLIIFMAGLIVATFACSLAVNFHTLLIARFCAGLFGGPMMPIAIAIISDNIPPERRGAAIGKVMGAFSAASVLGVPFGLELAHRFGWKFPFIGLSVIAVVLAIIAAIKLPSQKHNIAKYEFSHRLKVLKNTLTDKVSLGAFAFMGLFFMSAFMIIPNIATHVQFNMGFPRGDMGLLYLCGGAVSFFGMIIAGKMTDKYGTTNVTLLSVVLMSILVIAFLVFYKVVQIPVIILFTLFMVFASARNVSGQTLSSKVAKPTERAGFASLQSSVVHLSCAIGAFASSLILTGDETHINNIEYVGIISILISFLAFYILFKTERALKARHKKMN